MTAKLGERDTPSRPLVALIVLLACLSPALAEDSPTEKLFRDKVAPVFQRRCLECHNAEEKKGGLSLESAESLAETGDSGPSVVAQKPDESFLLELITPVDGRAKMPRDGDPLKPDELAVIREWIKGGAAWPKDLTLSKSRVTSTDWWSLKQLVRPAVPPLSPEHAAWARTPVDAFIAARHRQLGLSHAPEADRRTLIRRLSYDLIGLPPTPVEIEAFVTDPDPEAYETLVDKLLSSSQYGERWARHWLDLVHYGETHGYDKDKPRPNAWPYRDYVIRAFNGDRPFGRFIEEQIAGDVLYPDTVDGLEALGFIAAGPWDFIGHAEVPESKIDGKVARHLDRDDMIANTLQTFCSLTVQCAQCHNHKFDPITQEDYYRLQAVFAAVDRTDVRYDADPEIARRRRELERIRGALTARRTTLDQQIAKRAGQPLADATQRIAALEKNAQPGTHPPEFGYHSGIAARPDDVKWVQVDLRQPAAISKVVLRPCHDDFNGIGDGFGFPQRFRVELSDDVEFKSGVLVLADFTGKDVANPGLAPQTIAVEGKTGRYLRVTATRLAPRLPTDFIFALAELEAFDASGKNLVRGTAVTSLDTIEAPVRWARANLADGLYPGAKADLDELARLRESRTKLIEAATTSAERDELADLTRKLAENESVLTTLPPQRTAYIAAVHTGSGAFSGTGANGGKPRPIQILKRGNVTQPGAEVEPGAIAAISPLEGVFRLPTDHPEGARRAALAKWLSDPRHPLTWRSIVNRVWQHHFGRGLVDTPNDFGRNGRLPSHPELLDWLAVEFRDGGQSLKKLHRLILTSSVYRQASSARNPQAAATDAENRELWRMNRRKLEAEQLRDSVLLLSGRMNRTMYGPSFQDFVIDKPEHSPHYDYGQHNPGDPASHRRSIYRFLVRSQPQPFMSVLDCADPSMQVDKRNESVSSLQALALLNNGFMLTMSRSFAERIDARALTLEQTVELACEEAFGRRPTAQQRTSLVQFAREHGLPNLCRILVNSNAFVFVD